MKNGRCLARNFPLFCLMCEEEFYMQISKVSENQFLILPSPFTSSDTRKWVKFPTFSKSCSKKIRQLNFFSGGRHGYVSNLNDVKSGKQFYLIKQLLTFDNFFSSSNKVHTWVGKFSHSDSKITTILSGKTLKRKCTKQLHIMIKNRPFHIIILCYSLLTSATYSFRH